MKRKTIVSIIIIAIVLTIILLSAPLKYSVRSYTFMYFNNIIQKKDSLFKSNSIELKMPGGRETRKKDWYPFVLYHNDNEGFSRYIGKKVSLTILYNFGHFNILQGMSSFFDSSSQYYSGFYGAYIVKEHRGKSFVFFEDGSLNIEGALKIPQYDYKYLVLESLGCPKNKRVFNTVIEIVQENISYIGYDGWTRVDSKVITNGSIHNYTKNLKAYIQYGVPRKEYFTDEEFPIIKLYGRTYVKYFREKDVTIFLYILAPKRSTIESCDEEILSKSNMTL